MGKRKRDSSYYKRKIRKLEKQLKKVEDDEIHSGPSTPPVTEVEVDNCTEKEPDPAISEQEQLPEEFLLALGTEGVETEDIGEPINPELALRWTKIMASGLGKEARDNITKKYPTPQNFPSAVAPLMNAEILASLSELSVKRDKRIVHRQNFTGKIMSCLGKTLTSILKGNINSRMLIEEINDAAKLAAEIHYQDSSSRKFFALAGTNKTVQEAVKNTTIDKYLFGIDCADKIKTAQTIKKTGSILKNLENVTTKKPMKTSTGLNTKKQLNWKSPPQYQQPRQQNRQTRGGQHHMISQNKRQPFFDRSHPVGRHHPPTGVRSRYHR
ncbi:hypothetical protein ACJJTC_018752 [Scirpophaga incertulas]